MKKRRRLGGRELCCVQLRVSIFPRETGGGSSMRAAKHCCSVVGVDPSRRNYSIIRAHFVRFVYCTKAFGRFYLCILLFVRRDTYETAQTYSIRTCKNYCIDLNSSWFTCTLVQCPEYHSMQYIQIDFALPLTSRPTLRQGRQPAAG